jgi:hypothetical protein
MTTILTPFKTVKNQNFRARNLAKWALTCYGGSTRERLLSESSRSYMLAFRVYAICFWSKSPKEYLN